MNKTTALVITTAKPIPKICSGSTMRTVREREKKKSTSFKESAAQQAEALGVEKRKKCRDDQHQFAWGSRLSLLPQPCVVFIGEEEEATKCGKIREPGAINGPTRPTRARTGPEAQKKNRRKLRKITRRPPWGSNPRPQG